MTTTTALRTVMLAAVLTIATLLGSTGTAHAAPGDPPAPLPLDAVGSSPTLTFPGLSSQVTLFLPVPDGLVPESLRGLTESPAFVGGGSIDVVQDGRVLSRTAINAAPNSPIELPLTGIDVQDQAVELTLITRLDVDNTCTPFANNAFRIINAEVAYGGREALPGTVADFLPSVLRQLTIFIPDDVQQSEGAAAVALTSAVTAHYGFAHPEITTAALPRSAMTPPNAPGPLERQIVIDTAAPAGLSVSPGPEGSSYLTIGGSADQLTAQSALLVSDLSGIAASSAAVAGPQSAAPQLAPTVRTLADIGFGDTTVASTGWPEVTVGIDQTRLGRWSTNVQVQLTGSYTPIESGVIAVRVGDRVIDTIPTDASGTFDTRVEIPNDVLRRYTAITVALESTGQQVGCLGGSNASLSVLSSGEVTSDPAGPNDTGGFGALPQALLPRVQLAWTTGDVADVSRAVSIVAALQRMSTMPVGVDVVDVGSVADSGQPTIVIAADGAGVPDLDLPVTSDGSTITVRSTDDDTRDVTLTPGLSYGSVQVVRDGDRSVVVATSTDDTDDLDQLLTRMTADDLWSSTDGDALVQVAGRAPVVVQADTAVDATAEDSEQSRWSIVVAAVLVAALILGALVVLMRSYRRTGANKPSVGEPATTATAPTPNQPTGEGPGGRGPDAGESTSDGNSSGP